MENLTKELILKTISDNSKKIREFGVKRLILFGSFAKDEQNENSDIDFLVEFNDNRGNFDDCMDLQFLFEDLFNRKIDLVKPHLVRDFLKADILEGVQHEAKI